jgi:hypothetical protein
MKTVNMIIGIGVERPSPEQRELLRRLFKAARRGRRLLGTTLDTSHWRDIVEHVEGIVQTIARAGAAAYNRTEVDDELGE